MSIDTIIAEIHREARCKPKNTAKLIRWVDELEACRSAGAVEDADLVALLKAEMKTAGKNQMEYAASIGISPQYMSDVFKGNRGVSERMAEHLGYRPVWIRKIP